MQVLRRLVFLCVTGLAVGADAAPTQDATPYSLIVGQLVGQKVVPGNPCEPDEDICMDVMIETRVSDVRVLSGNRVPEVIRFRHRMHAPYRPGLQLQVAAVVLRQGKGVRRGIFIDAIEDGQFCLPQSWFQPGKDLLPMPHGHSPNADGDVCFVEGRDF